MTKYLTPWNSMLQQAGGEICVYQIVLSGSKKDV